MPEQPPERPVADPPERSYREIAAGLSSHCCFAGCTLVTCNFCHEQRCVNDLHLCTPKPGRFMTGLVLALGVLTCVLIVVGAS